MKARNRPLLGVIVSIICVHFVASNPLKDPHLCGQPQCEPSKKFNYAVGTKYTYKYVVDVHTLFRGTSANKSSLYTDALVHVTFFTPCQGLLQISDVTLSAVRPKYNLEADEEIPAQQLPRADEFARAITTKSLRFNFQDGVISELCPDPADPVWVLNYKRGVLSAFHNTMLRFDVDSSDVESDVNGQCVTNYQLQGAEGTALVITKEKEIASCKGRYKYHAIVQTDPYNFGSSFQAAPLVKSRHRCKFAIDRKMYQHIECEEVHTFQPFSQAENGSQAITRQTISFQYEFANNATLPGDAILKRTKLMFDHNATPKPTSGELKASRDLIKTLCRLDTDNLHLGYTDAFTKMVHVGRRLSYAALTQIYTRAGSLCTTGKKHITDVLPYLGSNAAVAVMVENLPNVSNETSQAWLTAIGFIPHPDEETLSTFLKLLNYPDNQVLLSLSALTHTFCKIEHDCHLRGPVQKIITHLVNQLSNCDEKLLTTEQRNQILISLKAIGNIGVTVPGLSSAMRTCVLTDNRDIEIRVAAVSAHRRTPCLDSREFFLDIYRNSTMDTEIRIASYLQVMRCPNYHIISLIRQQLDQEEVNQVGSFVWSHLQNQLTSSMPTKVEVQTLLTDRILSDKFNKDRRKFSRSYESSMFFDEFNAGGNIEGHIIFSPKSYVPRTLRSNLTLDLFGETVNVVELEARMEGLEHLVEGVFGPSGPFSATQVQKGLNSLGRIIRSAEEDYHYNDIPNVIDNDFKVPKVSLGYKIFGNEMFYSAVTGIEEFKKLQNSLNPIQRLKDLLSGQEVVFDKASMFVEGDYIVPTGAGLPVTLNIKGTSAVHLNMAGNIRSLQLWALDIEGKLKPSVAVEITGEMGVDAFYASTGIKLKSSLYTSTAVEGHVKVEGKNKATVSFNLPKEKGEIITAQTKLIIMNGDKEEEQSGITDRRVETNMCSWPSLDQTLGLKACMSVAFPNASSYIPDASPLLMLLPPLPDNGANYTPSFFLSGPSLLTATVRKADPTAEKYVLKYLFETYDNKTSISLVFDTPGSKQQRELSARLLLDSQSKNLTLLLHGMENKFEAHGNYKDTPTEKYLDFSLDINGKKHMAAQVGLRTRPIKNGFVYIPRLFLAINSERVVELTGNVKVLQKKDITLYEVDLHFRTKRLNFKISGFISKGQASWATKMTVNYKFIDGSSQRFMVDLRVGNTSSKSLTQYNGDLTIESTAYSYLNFVASIKYQRAQGHAECKLIVNTRPELKDDKHKFTVHGGFSLHQSYERRSYNAFIEITKPISNIDLRLGINLNMQDEKSTTYVTLRYATGKEVVASLALSLPRTNTFQLDGKLNVSLPGFVPMIVVLKLDERKKGEYDIDFEGVWFSGHNLTATGGYTDKSRGLLKSYGLKLFVQSPSFEDVTVVGKFITDEHQFKLELWAEHMNEKYSVALKQTIYKIGEMEAYAEIRYKASLYSVSTVINMEKPKQVLMEIHLDKHRDIHITLSGINQVRMKEAGLEIKWDANRDPGQRFAAHIRFEHPKTLEYLADVLVSYPGRKLLGSALFSFQGTKFDSLLRFEWSPADVLDVRLGAIYSSGNITDFKINSQLLTPFVGWKRTSISGGFHNDNNLVQANSSVWWQDDQMVGVNIYWDYELPESSSTEVINSGDDDPMKVQLTGYFPDFWCAFNASLLSSIADVRPAHAAFSHHQKENTLATNIHWQGKTLHPVLVKSHWELEDVTNLTRITGNVTLQSPYKGYYRGVLLSRLYYTPDFEVDGFAELNVDRKEYFGTIKGHVTSLRDSMLVVNLTSPIPQFAAITGRIGYSEAGRHLVCMWTMPSRALGVEIKLAFENNQDFDLLFHVSTPLDFFTQLLLLGKRKADLIDARVGFNELLLGVAGSWRYASLVDFDYKYSLYTPLEGFHETAVVAKVVVHNGLDIDLRVLVAGVKVGATVLWSKKAAGLRKVLLKMPNESAEEDDSKYGLRWKGVCVLDTYLYPTITCNVDLDEVGSTIVAEGNLLLPAGNVYLYDEMFFEDMFNIKNDLQIRTPFKPCPEITSVANWHLVFMDEMVMEVEVHVRADNITQKGGLLVKFKRDGPDDDYDYEEEGDEGNKEVPPSNYAATIQFHSPWQALKLLRMTGIIELENTKSKGNLTILTTETWFTIEAGTVIDKDYLRGNVRTMLNSTKFIIPEVIFEVKTDRSEQENIFELLAMCQPLNMSYTASGSYNYVPGRELKVSSMVETSLQQLEHLKVSLALKNDTDALSMNGRLQYRPGIILEISGHKNQTAVAISAERFGVASLNFDGKFEDDELGNNRVKGALVMKTKQDQKEWKETVYKVDNQVIQTENQPLVLRLTLQPQTEGDRSIFVNVDSERTENQAGFNFSLTVGREKFDLEANADFNEGQLAAVGTHVKSTLHPMKGIDAQVNVNKIDLNAWNIVVSSRTEWEKLKHVHFNGNYWAAPHAAKVHGSLETDAGQGKLNCEYSWLKAENIVALISTEYQLQNDTDHHARAEIFYKHPNKNLKFVSTGIDFELDRIYRFGTNATIKLPTPETTGFTMHLKLPQPGDIHSIDGRLQHTAHYSYVAHRLQYFSDAGKALASSSGEFSQNKTEIQGNVKVEWGIQPNIQAITNSLLLKRPNNNSLDLQYTLHTPYYAEDTVVARLSGDKPENVWDIACNLFSPRSNQLASANISYMKLDNVNGTVRSKTPFAKISHVGADFQVISDDAGHYRRYLTAEWPNSTAVLKSDYHDLYNIPAGPKRQLTGKLHVEIPLATRHVTDVDYNYQDAYPYSSGECQVVYNSAKLLNGKYNCESEAKAGYNKDDMNVTVQNEYFPLGAHYIHEVDYDGRVDDSGTRLSTDRKRADIFRLDNRTAFNVKGELQVKTLETGKEIKFSAVQANSTVDFSTDYHFLDHQFTHNARLELAPTVWGSYYLDIVNKTTVDQDEGNIRLDIAYPRKNFTITGHIRQDSQAHESDLRLDWDRTQSPKTVGAGFDWRRVSRKPDQQVATLRFKHPSFVKDVTFNGTYIRHGTKSFLTRLDVEYSNIADKKLVIEGNANDLSTPAETLYEVNLTAVHPATRLDLAAVGVISIRPSEYLARGDARYQRSFLGQQNGHVLARIDGIRREVDFQKRLQHEEAYLRARLHTDDACCTRLNGSLAKTQSINYTGDFFVDLDEKLLLFVVNMTPDASENFRAHGFIPDSRNAELNVWRTYDDLAITDIAFFLRLNHSRLVTSRLKWRPTLRKEFLQSLEDIYTAVLKNLDETVEYWKEYIRSEVKEAVVDIYYNSKPDIQQYLDDLEDLKSLENDFEEFRTFLNDSYNRNDFYVKDVAGVVLLLVDELALKKHFETLPAILGEMWQALGDSGEAIRKSLLWIIETIKSSYRKAVELIHQILHGDSGAKLSSLLEDWINKYDRMVKELQMTVLRHLEQLYNNISESISEAWNNLLKSIEPTYIQILHYMEQVAFTVSTEFLDLLYETQAGLKETPFFLQVANFTQDLDRLHKDLTNRDLITNIRDYSNRFYLLLKDRYLPKIPFGREIQQVINEIIEGFQDLEKLPSVSYMIKKKNEVVERVTWFWKSLDLDAKIQRAVTLIHRRLIDISANALQSENKYREAKTKFIFEPIQGLVLLEQKLPMSWHAFNETPRFEEIPEYRALAILQSQLAFSNKTFWTFYYEYKPYTEIENWFPPFKAQAIIVGSQHLLTFDGEILSFRGSCDYLLARDFVNENFTLIMRHNSSNNGEFLLTHVMPNHTLTIDIFNDHVILPNGESLPAQLGHVYVYREKGVVYVEERDGYTLECNVMFQVCTLSLSGWYFGKTAGLLGTMDHEKATDFLTSRGVVSRNADEFINSWALNNDKCSQPVEKAFLPVDPQAEIMEQCQSLFEDKTSLFSSCFGHVDPRSFFNMCLVSDKEKCSAAAAYVQACQTQYTLLSMPDTCIRCMHDSKNYSEGQFIKFRKDDIPTKSADVVFIVEAKECNQNMSTNRNMELFFMVLAKELNAHGFKDKRYATVVFGGDGVYNKPRALIPEHSSSSKEGFTSAQNTLRSFEKFRVGNGTEDIFDAVAFATSLPFRPGVSKIFIVIPCSSCNPANMTVEYSVLRQIMLEKNIYLHLLINDNFGFEKQRLAKIFYGMDKDYAFTKKDFPDLKGDSDFRQQVKLPKSMVAYCAPLALETNGTVFGAKWMEGEKKNAVKKFANVFAKRLVLYSKPPECSRCECASYESGMGYLDCRACEFPQRVNINLGPTDDADTDGSEFNYDGFDDETDDDNSSIDSKESSTND